MLAWERLTSTVNMESGYKWVICDDDDDDDDDDDFVSFWIWILFYLATKKASCL